MKGYNTKGQRTGSTKVKRTIVQPGNRLDLQRTLVFALAYMAKHMGQGTADDLIGLGERRTHFMADVEATRSLIIRLASIMSGNGNMQECLYPFTIGDAYDLEAKHVFGRVKYGGVGVELTVDGYGEHNAQDGMGSPVYLEMRKGIPYLVVWADINSESPTHEISLEGAAESLRILSENEEVEDGQEQEETREETGLQASDDHDEAEREQSEDHDVS